ncbi:VWA domain-containing protein [Candidatus Methylacidithermus pantelleriae]|uniref:BatA (Bacteroides aerotolerance operon) n=1 Tax=Candidatus Methylacidithermus pantelleriae TaxID=2744239 RepID=A0A8J2BPX4_9BACT|nr:VWA domain-containing protein [Candidatus Methylacidithermus pantelleriae]CAF0689024.1 BatA (Bacteroides aerotolerance operon) [Candidatus Methylacidithermus pantelleriae]
MEITSWQKPLWLLALLVLPVLAWARRAQPRAAWVIPHAGQWLRRRGCRAAWPTLLSYLGLVFLILALCRPQGPKAGENVRKMGYDIMLVLDISGSMQSEDYVRDGRPLSRLDAVRPVVEAFLKRRQNDRMGLIVFAGHPYTLAPLTFDHAWLRSQLARVRAGLAEDGTAIGDALGLALIRLGVLHPHSSSFHSSRFIVVLTDGANNCGRLNPLAAAQLCRKHGVPVYTVGAGKGNASSLAELDEPLLKAIAEETGGEFFRAPDSFTVEAAFRAIDAHRPSILQETQPRVKEERFGVFALAACLCWIAAWVLVTWRVSRPSLPRAWLSRLAILRRSKIPVEVKGL